MLNQGKEKDMTKPLVVTVNILHLNDWYKASSSDLRGFLMTWDNLAEMIGDLPQALKLYYQSQFGMAVQVKDVDTILVNKLLIFTI